MSRWRRIDALGSVLTLNDVHNIRGRLINNYVHGLHVN